MPKTRAHKHKVEEKTQPRGIRNRVRDKDAQKWLGKESLVVLGDVHTWGVMVVVVVVGE